MTHAKIASLVDRLGHLSGLFLAGLVQGFGLASGLALAIHIWGVNLP